MVSDKGLGARSTLEYHCATKERVYRCEKGEPWSVDPGKGWNKDSADQNLQSKMGDGGSLGLGTGVEESMG